MTGGGLVGDVDLNYLAGTMAKLSGIPIRVYRKEEEVFRCFPVTLPRDPLEPYRKEVFGVTAHVGYYATPMFHLYGVVNTEDTKIVVGPTAQILAGGQKLRELAFRAGVPPEETQEFVDGIRSIAPMPLENLLAMLCAVNHVLNGETLELEDVAIYSEEQQELKRQVEQQRTEKLYGTEAGTELHNTVQLEEALMEIVRKGDSAALAQWLSAAPPMHGGIIAGDQLRQMRNTFIVTATLASRAAIRGGLDHEAALSLSDAYIRRVEQLGTQNAIVNLQYNMVKEFTEQVEKIRRGKSPTKLSVDVANYVQRHLSEPISTDDMAKEFYLSRTHFSAKFKKETGMTLTDYILTEKTEEAKRLLRYSDKSAAEIAAYLGFSSQGHFAKVFKKYSGQTPNEFREKK